MPCGSFNSELSLYQSIHIGTEEERKERMQVRRLKTVCIGREQVAEPEGNDLITTLHNFVVPLRPRESLACTQVVKDMVARDDGGDCTQVFSPMLQGIVNTIPIISGAKEFFMSGSSDYSPLDLA